VILWVDLQDVELVSVDNVVDVSIGRYVICVDVRLYVTKREAKSSSCFSRLFQIEISTSIKGIILGRKAC
jgi:hypothetical protein